jgi:catechol 2,3-dioxygenase-like lactoylglutathione lyase family enzyme
MLGDNDVAATIAVKDMEVAKRFYEGTLGLKRGEMDDPGGIIYKSGNSSVLVYESQFAGTNEATAASWAVDDLEGIVQALKTKGVKFEQYDNLPGVTRNGDVHMIGTMKAVWFKDPDGNILNISSQ